MSNVSGHVLFLGLDMSSNLKQTDTHIWQGDYSIGCFGAVSSQLELLVDRQ